MKAIALAAFVVLAASAVLAAEAEAEMEVDFSKPKLVAPFVVPSHLAWSVKPVTVPKGDPRAYPPGRAPGRQPASPSWNAPMTGPSAPSAPSARTGPEAGNERWVSPAPLLAAGVASPSGACLNRAGVDLIKSFEGFRANFYNDAVGVRTIGYGHACQPSSACDSIRAPLSEAQATALLAEDLTATYSPCVSGLVTTPISTNQFSALVSFAFNLGCNALKTSTLLKQVNARNFAAAAAQFGQWVNAGGQRLEGLVRRRAAEKALFDKPVSGPAESECVDKSVVPAPVNADIRCATSALNMRERPETGAPIIFVLGSGEQVTVTKGTAAVAAGGFNFVAVSARGKAGWVASSFLGSCATATSSSHVLMATPGLSLCATDALNVRGAASTSGAVLFVAARDEKLSVTGPQEVVANGYTWLPVSGRGQNGWAVKTYLQTCPSTPPPAPSTGWTLYKQCGEAWSGAALGTCSRTVCSAGCAMSSVAMILRSRGVATDPGQLNTWLRTNGGYAGGCNIYWAKVDAFGKTKCQGFKNGSYTEVCNWIKAKYGVVLNVNGGGHWVLGVGCDGNGNVLVNDPGYAKTSYPFSEVKQEVLYQ